MRKQLNFHYSREERLSQPGAPRFRVPRKGGLFRRNRSLLIVLIDVLLISVVFFLYRQFFASPTYESEIAGYKLLLRVFPVKDKVIVNLRVTGSRAASDGEEGDAQAPDRVFVRFLLGEDELRLSERLPNRVSVADASADSDGEYVELAGSFMIIGEQGRRPAERLVAEVQIGEEQRVLTRQWEGPR